MPTSPGSVRARGIFALFTAGFCLFFAFGMHRGVLLSNAVKTKFWPFAPYVPAQPVESPALSDPVWQFVPWLSFARHELLEGRLPLWNPHQDGGVPLLGNSISALGSPLLWPAIVFGVDRGWNLSLLLRLLVALAGTYLWLRDRGRSVTAATFGAASFGLSGAFIAWLEHPQTLAAAPIPLLLLFAGRLAEKTSVPNLAGTVIASTLILAGGHPETALFAALLTSGYVLLRKPRPARVVPPLAAGLFAAGLTAPLLLPFLEYFVQSAARFGAGRHPFVLPARALARFVFPGQPGSHPIEAAATVSLAALLLVPFGLALRRDLESVFWALVGAICLLVAYDNPIARSLARGTSIYFTRALLVLPLAAAFLASAGLDALRERAAARGRRPAATALAGLIVLTAGLELLLAAQGVHAISPSGALTPSTPLLRWLKEDGDVFHVLPLHSFLPPNMATEVFLDDLRGYDALGPRAWRLRRAEIGRFRGLPNQSDAVEPWDLAPGGAALDAWNVKYLLLHPQFGFGAEELNGRLGLDLSEVYSGPDGRVLLNRRALPRVRWESSDPGRPAPSVLRRTPTRWTIDVSSARMRRLVVANPFFPGWTAEVDGRLTPIAASSGQPFLIEIPAGHHVVELLYRPQSFLAGLGLAAVSAAALAAWSFRIRRR